MKNLKNRTGREKTQAAVNIKKHLFCILAFALIVAMPLTTCKQEPDVKNNKGGSQEPNVNNGGNKGDPQEPNVNNGGNKDDPKVYLVDVSEETDWDYLVVAKDGSSAFYNVDETTGIPTSLFFKPKKDSDNGTTILFKENGLPDRMVSNGYILVYGNFRGYQYDMAIIKPDNTIEYHYNIETDINWDAYNARAVSRQGRSVLGDFDKALDIAGTAVGIGTCGAMFAFPPAVVGCATFLASEAGGFVIDQLVKAGALDQATADAAHIIIDAFNCGGGLDFLDCIQAVSGVVSLIFGDDIQLLQNKITEVLESVGTIEGGGMSWEVLESSSSFSVIANGNRRFVAGSGARIGYSTDGIEWTTGTVSGLAAQYPINAIAYGNDTFYGNGTFVIGTGMSNTGGGRIAYSDDGGESWTIIREGVGLNMPLSVLGGSSSVKAIAYGGGRFVAVGDDRNIAYSPDGENWTRSSIPNEVINEISTIAYDAYDDGRFVAGGSGIAYSFDGISWTRATAWPSGWTVNDIAYGYGKGRWVAGCNGFTGSIAYSDDGGENWTAVTGSPFKLGVNAIAYGDDRFVAASIYGNISQIAYSTDGENWTLITDSAPKIYDIAYDGLNGMFVAVGEKIMYCDWPDYYAGWRGGRGGDSTAPALSSGSVNRTGDTQATIGFTSSEAGMAYYTVQNSGAAAPATNIKVRNGVPLGAVTAGANSNMKVVTLTAGAKDIYVVVQDAAGNVSEPLMIAAAAYSSGGGGNNNPGGSGLTINNLPAGTSFSVFVFSGGTDISTLANAAAALSSSYLAAGVEPSGGVYSLITPASNTWTGTGNYPVLLYNANGTTEQENPMFRQATVNFTNGTCTVSFSGFTAVLE